MSTLRKGAYGFDINDECHFEIYAEENGIDYSLNEESIEFEYTLNISVKAKNSIIYLNNGTSIYTASDQVMLSS
jgi:hypothetical protein